jgi:phosphomethylpyrimidine synthase
MTADNIMATLRMQMRQGISSVVIHGVSREMLGELRRKKRLLGMVSKGGSITSAFMLMNQCENPFVEHFDEVLSLCRKHDIVLSLGNTARSGWIYDRRDRMHLAEIRQNVQLADRAHAAGVQVIIERAGGHIRSDRIAPMVKYYKKQSAYPLFVAGPLPTDVAIGYDHIAGAAGASIASAAGADYLYYITPAEHRASRAAQSCCGKRGPDCIQDCCTHRGYREVWERGGGYKDCPVESGSRPGRSDPLFHGSGPGPIIV